MPVRLFVGNLSYDATEAELRQHFGTIGPVSYCYLPTDRETGRPRGFAFVEFGDDALAQEAISRLNNQPFRGRPLAVKEAQPRESRPGGGPGAPRPGFSSGPRPPGRPMGAMPPSDAAGAPGRRPGNFGPDAPPKGKKGKFKGAEARGPKGPIRVKPNGRIYSTDAYGEDDGTTFEGDDFATSAQDGADDDDLATGAPDTAEDDDLATDVPDTAEDDNEDS